MQTESDLQPSESSILADQLNLEESNKKIRNARGWLFVVSAMQFIVGIIEYATIDDKSFALIAFAIDASVAAVFLVLALTTKRKPYLSLVIALIAYIVFVIILCTLDPANIAKGILVKVFFVIALVKGIKAAKEAEALRKIAGSEPE